MSRWAAFVWRIENHPRDHPLGSGDRDWCVLGGPGRQNRGTVWKRGHVGRSLLQLPEAPPEADSKCRAIGIDQVPESLFPLLACRRALSLTVSDIAVIVVTFFISEILISRVLYKFGLRDRPY